MSNIPQARVELKSLRQFMPRRCVRRFDRAIKMLDRRPQHHRAYGTRAKMTPALARYIKSLARANPTWTQQRIAEKANVTNARVSEVLHGKSR